jgi:predicted ATPase with chaperone activity
VVFLQSEVSPTHHETLSLDAWPAFRRHVLKVLGQPLEKSVLYIQSPERPRSIASQIWLYGR